jgi:hypothetical protein
MSHYFNSCIAFKISMANAADPLPPPKKQRPKCGGLAGPSLLNVLGICQAQKANLCASVLHRRRATDWDETAFDEVKKWRWHPAMKNGKPCSGADDSFRFFS